MRNRTRQAEEHEVVMAELDRTEKELVSIAARLSRLLAETEVTWRRTSQSTEPKREGT